MTHTTADVLADAPASGPAPELGLAGTRSSHRWASMPGNWDKLNCRAMFPADNDWGVPALPVAEFEPARLVPYTDRRAAANAAGTGTAALHFFLDDYRFEVVWSKPERGLSRCAAVGAALTPDFSLYRDMPLAMQLWQVYRSRWCGAWLLHHGIDVVPTVSWSTPDSYAFAFAGIPARSVVAVSTVGVWRDPVARGLFADGYAEMLRRLDPAVVLVHGKPPTEQVRGSTPVRCYPTRWDGGGR
ncbi:DUF4417 domain-containing protein [Amycolatopsis sp. La24]|uniref:DUF4417 domain-containing protein n=1 Tax=Amycolatopsis sp. La24 TaxID=3028304 RepID=UPI0023B1A390|nr:DUF4417 domain-containing protein [Amycolatopsis sp. La24]